MRAIKQFKVAVCGAGVVGGGVVELIKRQRPFFLSQRVDFVVKTVRAARRRKRAVPSAARNA
jgi:homoserine dehydrogenase